MKAEVTPIDDITREKYVVFKADEFQKLTDGHTMIPVRDLLEFSLDNFVVIRTHDIFAPPALYTYAHQVQSLIEFLDGMGFAEKLEYLEDVSAPEYQMKRAGLESIRDYFYEKASQAESLHSRKVPD